MSATTRLFLIRHGETLANRQFRYIGRRDDALSETGERQAAQLAEALAPLYRGGIQQSSPASQRDCDRNCLSPSAKCAKRARIARM